MMKVISCNPDMLSSGEKDQWQQWLDSAATHVKSWAYNSVNWKEGNHIMLLFYSYQHL